MDYATDRKPRLALMGEFSVGKSTLTNLLLGAAPLPTQVTATRLPPVWLRHGTGPAMRLDEVGEPHRMELSELSQISPDTTRLVQLEMESEMLELCDLIDLPGISDPNMPTDLWHSLMEEVDLVVWCTHATQAWRQSEAAAWEAVQKKTVGPNLLLVTQIDKLTSQRDRDRVMARVESETAGLFASRHAISLTQAITAGENEEAWINSGAANFTNDLIDALLSCALSYAGAGPSDEPCRNPTPPDTTRPTEQISAVSPRRVKNRIGERLRTRPITPGFDTPVLRDMGLVPAGERS